MGDSTAISWTDHTFNPWWGCTKIAPGCDNCYAASRDHRVGGDHWNTHKKPRRTGRANWNKVKKWNQQAFNEKRRHRVFCGSMMDWCDKDAPPGARDDLWELIRSTPYLDWQLLTKRATLIEQNLPSDWYDWGPQGYVNVWLGVTVENFEFGFPRIDALRTIPATVRFISAEPLIAALPQIDLSDIHWVIVGGESGPRCRSMNPEWAECLLDDCLNQCVPVWFKQWGGNSTNKGGCVINGSELKQWPLPAEDKAGA